MVRDLELGNLESFDRYWMWAAGLEYLANSPWATAFSVAPGGPVDVDVPRFVADLWVDQQDNLSLEGIFPFHFHAMWLRLVLTWGWLPVAIGAMTMFRTFVADRRRNREARPFFAVCAILGLTMGLIYLGNVALVVLLAGQRVLQRRLPRSHDATATSPLIHDILSPIAARHASSGAPQGSA